MTKDFDSSHVDFTMSSIEQALRIKQLERENEELRRKLENPSSITDGPGGIAYAIVNSEMDDMFLKRIGGMLYDSIENLTEEEDPDIAYLVEHHFSEAYDLEELLQNFHYMSRHHLRNCTVSEEDQAILDNSFSKELEAFHAYSAREPLEVSDYTQDLIYESMEEHAQYCAEEVLSRNPDIRESVLETLRVYARMAMKQNTN